MSALHRSRYPKFEPKPRILRVVKIVYLCYSFFVGVTISAIQSQISDDVRWGLLQRKAQETFALRAFALFRKQGIEPILIKGLAAARYYPSNIPRISVDMDLAVAADDLEVAREVVASPEADGLAIDVHRELRHLDTVDWQDLYANSRLLKLEGGTIRVLRPEDHLRVLCVHWLTDGGSHKDRLWDICYTVENRPADFDWGRFLNVVSERRQRWLVCTIGLAHKYLGLDVGDTPVKDAAIDIPTWLTKTVEREWENETPLRPLEACLNNPKLLARQIGMRLRPNPIFATVDLEGSFDARTRVFYQIGNFFRRIPSSYRRVSASLKRMTNE